MTTNNNSWMPASGQNDISPAETDGRTEARSTSNVPAFAASHSPPVPTSEVQAPYVPSIVQRDGPLFARLRAMRAEAKWSTAEKERLDRLMDSLSTFEQRPRFGNARNGPREQFIEILNDLGARIDPVLRYVVAHHEGCEDLADQFYQAALESYSEHPRFYRRSFDELLPEDFRQQADKAAFSAGSNPTALDDWSTFEQLLNDDRHRIAADGLILVHHQDGIEERVHRCLQAL